MPDEIVVEELYSPQDAMNWFGVQAGSLTTPARERHRIPTPRPASSSTSSAIQTTMLAFTFMTECEQA
ncbi:hypothetical protein [Rhizobium sp. BR 315]|uniref:hypothetical protein n=1 Tax=Rhizobium sp. BR 315 TaxID=3040014 RepID=UPI003D336027